MLKKLFIWIIFLNCGNLVFADTNTQEALRTFPAKTIFATLQGVNYPEIKIEEIPSNSISGLLNMVLLNSQIVSLSPATIIRDKQNNTQLQQYVTTLLKQPIAIQPDFQGRVWVIWQLTNREKEWVIENKLNSWKKE